MKYTLLLFIIIFFLPFSVSASEANNIFGIHLSQPSDHEIEAATSLVNNKGDWGYITIVIQENDRDTKKWQGVFDKLRKNHLIPIIRIATSAEGENWRRPEISDADSWVKFFESLNWVVKDRYIILFNEPNHGSEWGGEVDPKSYSKVVLAFAKALKSKNQDYFIMLSGFDASAPSWMPGMEDEVVFLQKIFNYQLSIFNYIDGWASHSYPNPGFSGSPYSSGRGTVKTYQWELDLLKQLGIKKDLPVFITETGWERKMKNFSDESWVANNFQIAFNQIWSQDSRVKAVTPFVLDYQGEPFLGFSWKKYQQDDYYQQYYVVQSLDKSSGSPKIIEKGSIKLSLPHELVNKSTYHFKLNLNNLGQGYWSSDYSLQVDSHQSAYQIKFSPIKDIGPFDEKLVEFTMTTKEKSNNLKIRFQLVKNNQIILESEPWQFNILPLPDLSFEAKYFPWGVLQGEFEIQIFDTEDRLVYKQSKIKVDQHGQGQIMEVPNITLDELYRVVIVKPGYLPRQNYLVFKKANNLIKFKRLLPFDINIDGKFDWNDVLKLFNQTIKN